MSRFSFVAVLLALGVGSLSVQAIEHTLAATRARCDGEVGIRLGLRDAAYHLLADDTCPSPAPEPSPSRASGGPLSNFANAGPLNDPYFFPVGVWLQDPRKSSGHGNVAQRYQDMGVNLLVGVWGSYTNSHEEAIPAGMWVMPSASDASNPAANASPKVVGYVVADEPDMNMRPEGCLLPPELKALADKTRVADPTRPIHVNFGKGFALPDFYHGADCPHPGASRDEWNGEVDFLPDQNHQPYLDWAAIPDILSVDFYPINDPWEPAHNKNTDAIGRAVRRTRYYMQATNPGRPVWAFIEVTDIDGRDEQRKPTVAEVTTEVQQALDNGADGIVYFAHCFNDLREACLLDDPEMVQHITKLNAQMQAGQRPSG